MVRSRRALRGMTLIELLLAMAIGAILLAGTHSVVLLGLRAEAVARDANEALYQGRFALDRMLARSRGAVPKLLQAPAAGTSGDWFAPTMYCRNAASKLIETVTSDTGCAGTLVLASNVSAFAAQLPAGAGALDRPVATLSLTLSSAAAPQPVTLNASVRLGGGSQ